MVNRLPWFLALFGCAAAAFAAPAQADKDDNPPGLQGGAGTNWENRPGVAGGPGASPDLKFWSREAWDEFCAESPARCGKRQDVGFGPDPRSLGLDDDTGARGQDSTDDPGETRAAADSDALTATQQRLD